MTRSATGRSLFPAPRAAALAAFAVPLAVYVATLPVGLTWAHDGADGGDLIAAARTLGIPHPPGYPLYTLVARLFLLAGWGTPAHRVALLSAVAGAGAAWVLYWLCLALVGRARWPLALSAALLWAFAPIPWGQAVIAEVYALSALLAVGFVAALLHWRNTGSNAAWQGAWLLFGLGMAHHLLIAACLVPAAVWAWEQRRRTDGRAWGEAAGLVALGLSCYLYLPLRAAASPPVNWGDARTPTGFWWVVSAAPYRHYVFALPLAEWPSRVGAWAALLLSQFKVWGVALGLWGAVSLHERDRAASWGMLGLFAVITLYAIGYNTTDSYVYLLPALAVFAAWVAVGLADIAERIRARRKALGRTALAGIAAALVALPALSLAMNWAACDLRGDREAQQYVDAALGALPADAVVLADGDRETFALWYARWGLDGTFRGEPISVGLLQFDWYRTQVQGRNPDLAWPDPALPQEEWLAGFLSANLGRRPIFVTAPHLAPAGWGLEPAGPLLRVHR
ncbi:MAG: DUF2723 domain-containing protein [Anaerolineales bacterium]